MNLHIIYKSGAQLWLTGQRRTTVYPQEVHEGRTAQAVVVTRHKEYVSSPDYIPVDEVISITITED